MTKLQLLRRFKGIYIKYRFKKSCEIDYHELVSDLKWILLLEYVDKTVDNSSFSKFDKMRKKH